MARRAVLSDLEHPDPETVAQVTRALRGGAVVAAPSDTVYGFLARARDPKALDALRNLKERSGGFILLVADTGAARELTVGVRPQIWARLDRVWPGPVTVVLPAAPDTPGNLVRGGIGIRVPRLGFLRALLRELGEPLVSTSANPPGDAPAVGVHEIETAFPEVELLVDGGVLQGDPSTVVDLRGDAATILRRGAGDAGPLLDPPR